MDQRGWLEREIARLLPAATKAEVRERVCQTKRLAFAGFRHAIGNGVDRQEVGVLVDEEYGAEIARQAAAEGILLSVPMERADCDVLELEYGDHALEHVKAISPDLPKLLIRHNVAGDQADNAEQLRRLLHIGRLLADNGRKLLLELLVPPTAAQLQSCGGDMRRYDEEVRPGLTIRAVEDIRGYGVPVNIWKIEGMYSKEDTAAVGFACTSGAESKCLVLGRNAPWGDVERWLRNAASSPGYDGFAIGRTIWLPAVSGVLLGQIGEDEAIDQIAQSYLRAVRCYQQAADA
jgi:myo-inositol catabolism protein IolC